MGLSIDIKIYYLDILDRNTKFIESFIYIEVFIGFVANNRLRKYMTEP